LRLTYIVLNLFSFARVSEQLFVNNYNYKSLKATRNEWKDKISNHLK
jgi:hypothetical protein